MELFYHLSCTTILEHYLSPEKSYIYSLKKLTDMKKLVVLLFICAAVVVACGKKVMPESDANNQSKTGNDKSASSGSQTTNTNTNASVNAPENGLPSFRDMQKSEASAQTQTMPGYYDKGKTVYVSKCNTCHALKTPGDYTTNEMKNILSSEIPKAKLDKKEAEQVTAYLLANAKK
jgi:cytochrome c5